MRAAFVAWGSFRAAPIQAPEWHILWTFSTNGPTRFGALWRQVEDISSRVLTERLRGLEQKGIVYCEYEPTIPPAVTYGITKRMKEIKQVLGELNRRAETWQNEDGAQPRKARVKSRSVRSQEVHST